MQREKHSMKQEISFSGKIKSELSRQWSDNRHCQLAEIAAIVSMCGKVTIDSRDRCSVKVRTENLSVARKYFTLLRKTFNIEVETLVSRNKNHENVSYIIIVKNHDDVMEILQGSNWVDRDSCCRRAFIRGAFLAVGSMSNPEKSYHIEIVCPAKDKAEYLRGMINCFGLDAKVIVRKKSYVVYLKEGAQIVDLLNVMEAPVALMEMENVRILKEMRNSVNRKVNCETANINKTVSAAVKQAEDIRYIRDTVGLSSLPEGLREIARIRLEYPNATLKELGELLETPLGKSGVNHRLRKLSEEAERLKENREEQS